MADLKMVKNEYVIPTEQIEYYKKEIMELLPKYRYNKHFPEAHYEPTNEGVDALLNEYNKNKGWMYPYFISHPNYIGNGKIAFSTDYHRKVNVNGVLDFTSWCKSKLYDWVATKQIRINGLTCGEATTIFNKFENIYNDMVSLQGYTIGQARVKVLVNGMSVSDIAIEYSRIRSIISSFNKIGKRLNRFSNTYVSKETANQYERYKSFLEAIEADPKMLTTKEDAGYLNELTKELDLRIVEGQKFSRIIGKFCRKLGIDKNTSYNQRFAKLGDDINELTIKRHTIVSINPIDYLTMSFGNSWKSCHTIDKFNDRHVGGEGYSGCYSGGTLSYMLDNSSVVYYTVDGKYDGTKFEFEPKMNRCMFHLGEDKLIQGRVYPQTNDGDQTIYSEVRNIMQKVVSEMFKVDNLWTLSKGTSSCNNVIISKGLHYKDYLNFNNCNVSYLKPEKNTKKIVVGHDGICPKCGRKHHNTNSILCDACENHKKVCPHCGREIDEFYNHSVEANGEQYCECCAHFCSYHQRWEIDTEVREVWTEVALRQNGRRRYIVARQHTTVCLEAIRENPARYRRDPNSWDYIDTEAWTEGCVVTTNLGQERYYAFKELAIRDGYKETYNGKWYHKTKVHYDRRTKNYYHDNDWDTVYNCYVGIVDEVRQQQEMLQRRAERRAAREARRNAENAA